MTVFAKFMHYRIISVVSLIALISGIVAAVCLQFPVWQRVLSTNVEEKQPSAIALASVLPETRQDTTPTENKSASIKHVADIFAVRTWEPPAHVLPPAPLAPPEAPLLPFKFLGRIADPQKGTAFLLTHGKDLVQVSVGDSVDGVYRVDKYENGQLYFLYQPLNIHQSIYVGSDL